MELTEENVLNNLNKAVKTSIKNYVVGVLVEEFRPIASDYVNIRNNGTTKVEISDVMSAFRLMMENNFEENVKISLKSITIGLGDEVRLGYNSIDYSEEFSVSDFRWFSAYIKGVRRRYILINRNTITQSYLDELVENKVISFDERNHFIERISLYYSSNPEVKELITEGKVFKFGGAVMLDPDFFFYEGWDLIHSPSFVALNIENNVNYFSRVFSRLGEGDLSKLLIQGIVIKK
jgi:hypothetical protein